MKIYIMIHLFSKDYHTNRMDINHTHGYIMHNGVGSCSLHVFPQSNSCRHPEAKKTPQETQQDFHHPSMAPSSQEEQFKKEFGKEGTTSVPLLEDDAKRVFVQVDQDKSLGSDR